MPGPLEGIRIVDLTQVVSGPLGTMLLADQGADVIKIENTRGGDVTRSVSTRRAGMTASFLNNNRSKRAIALDLKHPEGLAIVKDLLKNADVFIQNFRPGVVDRLGLSEAAVREVKPDIIYVSVSGFGDQGPFSEKPVYDPLVQALSGLTTIQGGSDSARPRLVRTIVPDKLTGITTAQAVTAALLHRYRTGEGQHVKVSMLDSVIAFLWHSDMGGHTFVGDEIPSETAHSFIDLIYETTTDFITVAVNTDKEWFALTEALERPEWRDDERFNTAEHRHRNVDARLELTQEVLKGNSADYWLERLSGYDVPCAPVLKRKDMIHHPQVTDNHIVQELDHSTAGKLRQTRPAAQFLGTPLDLSRGAPLHGEHTVEVLQSIGFNDDRISSLLENNVVRDAGS